LRAEADHGAISRLLYHQEAQELLLVRLAEKLDVDARDLRPILSTLAGKAIGPAA
jgi:N-acetylglutamate synthase-like GNAT family acetyltransferase